MDYKKSFGKRCYMQSLVQIDEIVSEEFEKLGFSFVIILQMESYHESGCGLNHTIQLNWGNM